MTFTEEKEKYHTAPYEEIIEDDTWRKTYIKITNEINTYIVKIDDETPWKDIVDSCYYFDKKVHKFLEPIYKELNRYACRASFYEIFPRLKVLETFAWDTKKKQERSRFHKGDFNSRLGGSWDNLCDIKRDQCSLCCDKDVVCCTFLDTALCSKCIKTIHRKLQEEGA